MRKIAASAIDIYQRYISWFLPPLCRYKPSCSEYTKQSILKFGFFCGGWKGFKRILRCNPLFPGGIDEVDS